MIKMTRRTNLTVVVKVVDLDTSHIYSHNHMVGIDKFFFSVCFLCWLERFDDDFC
jgi:hypothetical protein